MRHSDPHRLTRRRFLQTGLTAAAGFGLGSLLPSPLMAAVARAAKAADSTSPSGQLREFRITAADGEAEIGNGQIYRTWLYNGRFPGPELRVREGERLRIVVQNDTPEETTVHWHGIPVPNKADGVPGLTQDPIAPGASFVYEFDASPAGSYMYHSHVGLQIDRGLLGPLIIEERSPHVAYDREYTIVLDDYLPEAPVPLQRLAGQGSGAGGMMGGRGMGGGMMGRMMGGMMGGFIVPPYAGVLVNGRVATDPAVFDVRRGERVRLRLLNPSGATTCRVAVGGHPMIVTHADGQPVEPVQVDSLLISMGERYDVVVEANNPGVWPLIAASVEGQIQPARALLRYQGQRTDPPPLSAVPEGLRGGRLLQPTDLRSLNPLAPGSPDRQYDLILSGRNAATWTINDQVFPNAEPLRVERGERVRFNMLNRSMMIHPMHLHGHFFQVGRVLKDTVLVPPHMGRVSFDFIADNPGRWLFHCHNLYHLESGMAREVRVT